MHFLRNIYNRIFYGNAIFDSLSAPRSGQWKSIRDAHIKNNPTCYACGRSEYLIVHHIVPFHLNPELELDPNNLLTLCQGKHINCHITFGHNYNWTKTNLNVKQDAESFRKITEKWHI